MWFLRQVVDVSASAPFAAGMELVEALGELEARGPVALILEDLHWADSSSRDALLAAVRRLGDDRVLVLVATRDGDEAPHDGWDRLRYDAARCVPVALGALSLDDVVDLAAATGVRLDQRAAQRLHGHTAGHALYVRTLLTELTPAQLTAPTGDLPAPRSLTSAALARLGEMPSPAVALAGALAVLGGRSPLVPLGRVAGVDRAAVALEPLLATNFVTWFPSDPQSPVTYVHPLYRAAVYDDLSPARRQALHRAAVAVSDPATALWHRVAAADRPDETLASELEAEAARARHRRARDRREIPAVVVGRQ